MSNFVRYLKHPAKLLGSRLGKLDIELTERCNNNCIHCCINLPENDREAQSREMTTAQIQSILLEAAALGALQVRFTGGEPLLRQDFEELYLSARRLGFKVLISTNARLITSHLADLFARIPPLLPIAVTVYGMHQESYETVSRISGSFAEFKQGIGRLLEYSIPFAVSSVLLPTCLAELEEFEAWARTIPWMKTKPGQSIYLDLRYRRDDKLKDRDILSLRMTPEEVLAFLTREADTYRKELTEFASKFLGPPGDKLFKCNVGSGLCVDAYGHAQACLNLRVPELTVPLSQFALSNTNELIQCPDKPERLSVVLDKFTALNKLRAVNSEYLNRCASCFLKNLCEQCPAKSWLEHGTLDTPVKYLCDITHAQAHWLGWIRENESAWTVNNWEKRIWPNLR